MRHEKMTHEEQFEATDRICKPTMSSRKKSTNRKQSQKSSRYYQFDSDKKATKPRIT